MIQRHLNKQFYSTFSIIFYMGLKTLLTKTLSIINSSMKLLFKRINKIT